MRKTSSLMLLAAVVGCGNTNNATVDMKMAGPDMTAMPPTEDLLPESFPDLAPRVVTAVVGTSSLMTQGALHTVRLSDDKVTKNIDATIDQDNVVRAQDGKVFVLDRTHGSLRVYDPSKSFASPVDIATGDATVSHDKSDPADVLAIPGTSKVYVAMYGNDAAHAVGVIDTAQPSKNVIKWVAIPAAGSPLPRAAAFWFCGPSVYVVLQDLDANFGVTGPGRIAVIDPAQDALATGGGASTITLDGSNPGGTVYSVAASGTGCDQVLVADSGDFAKPDLAQNGSGIEAVDLTARKSGGFVLTGAALMGTPGTISAASKNLAFTVINLADFTQKVVAIDPAGKKVLGDVTPPAGFMPFAEVSPDGKLLVGVARGDASKGQLGSGLYIGAADGTKLTATPIDLGQPIYSISFY